MTDLPLQTVHDQLFERWGPQHWWPARSRFEMMIGAVLTQNTAWTNVEKAMKTLRAQRVLTPEALRTATQHDLAQWIRPAGYFNQKAARLKEMTEHIHTRFNGSLNRLFALDTEALRAELLSWKGIGPETADSILLYAGHRPVFVIDAYTRRMLERHGWAKSNMRYDELAQLFTDHLPTDQALFSEYHALIVRLGKEHCRSKPQCRNCPLESLLPKKGASEA